jgi:hypothetical protein
MSATDWWSLAQAHGTIPMFSERSEMCCYRRWAWQVEMLL